jgi:hypothetical protein
VTFKKTLLSRKLSDMSSKLINVTALIVARNIEDVLADASESSRQTFYIPYYQRKLVTLVLNKVRNHYITVKKDDSRQLIEILRYVLKEQTAIDRLIRESLLKVLEEEDNWMDSVEIPDKVPTIIFGLNRFD